MTAKKQNYAALQIGGQTEVALTAGTKAICEVLKAAETEAARVAAMNTLAELCRAPASVTVSNCAFSSK